MADVTGFYMTAAGTPFPASLSPRVRAIPSREFITIAGRSISLYSEPVTPNPTTGAYTLSLEPTVNALEHDIHYRIVGDYQDPHFYGQNEGAGRKDHFEQKIVVPLEGGSVGDLAVVQTPSGLAWQGSTPPPMSMLWLYMHPTYNPDSGGPVPVYTAPDGTTVEHGELVDWSA